MSPPDANWSAVKPAYQNALFPWLAFWPDVEAWVPLSSVTDTEGLPSAQCGYDWKSIYVTPSEVLIAGLPAQLKHSAND